MAEAVSPPWEGRASPDPRAGGSQGCAVAEPARHTGFAPGDDGVKQDNLQGQNNRW